MAIPAGLINTLRRYGLRNPSNQLKLEAWLDEALEAVAEGKGADVVSASSNGASFTRNAAMTTSEWASVLDQALLMIEKGVTSTSRSYGRIC